MFSDPMTVTYNGSSESLLRLSTLSTGERNSYGSKYATADGELSFKIAHSTKINGDRRVELTLSRDALSSTPITGEPGMVTNSVGIIFELDQFDQNSGDVDLLRAALLALVDATFQDRVSSGES